MSASHTTLETKSQPELKYPDPDDVLRDFHAAYAAPIIPIIEKFLNGPDGRSAEEFKQIESDFCDRFRHINESEEATIKEWLESPAFSQLKKNKPQYYIFEGMRCHFGLAAKYDLTGARELYSEVINYPLAQHYLAESYRTSCDENSVKAEQLFSQAVDAGFSRSYRGLGLIYWFDYRNSKKAKEYFSHAIRLANDAFSIVLKAKMSHADKDIIPSDEVLQTYVNATRKGSTVGLKYLARNFLEIDQVSAEKYFLALAERRFKEALWSLILILEARGGEENLRKAQEYLKKAADKEHAEANHFIAKNFLEAKDCKQAENYLIKAIKLSKGDVEYKSHQYLSELYRFGGNGVAKNIELAMFHARKEYERDSQEINKQRIVELFSEAPENPRVCYHAALALRHTKEKRFSAEFQKLLEAPPAVLNTCYEEAKDTPQILKTLIDENLILQILCVAETLTSAPYFTPNLVNMVIEYLGPISPFAFQIVKQEQTAKPLVTEMKTILSASSAFLNADKLKARMQAIEQAEQNQISATTAIEIALGISDQREEKSKDETVIPDAKVTDETAKLAVEKLKTVLTSCISLFGRAKFNARFVAIQDAEDKEISYQNALQKTLGI